LESVALKPFRNELNFAPLMTNGNQKYAMSECSFLNVNKMCKLKIVFDSFRSTRLVFWEFGLFFFKTDNNRKTKVMISVGYDGLFNVK